MIKRFALAVLGLLAAQAVSLPSEAQGISQKVAVCNPSFTNRCMAPDANGAIPITGSLSPSGTQDINIKQVGGNAVTTTVPVSDGGGSLTVDTLQLPASLGIKTSAASLSVAPSSDGVWPVSQSGTWNINDISGTISLPTGASTSALQTTGNTSLASIDTKLTSPLQVVGTVADNATDTGVNSIKIGCRYTNTPGTITTGNRAPCWSDNVGAIQVGLSAGNTGSFVSNINGSLNDNLSNTVQTFRFVTMAQCFDGTTWDKCRAAAAGLDSDGTGLNTAQLVAQLDDVSPTTVTENQFGNLRMTPNRALLTRPYATASQDWTYVAASGGISNTTAAVTLVAATASMRNYITACQLSSDALGAATEVVIRDGAAGTVIERVKLTTAGIGPSNMTFPTPLKSSVNTLLEAATLTATITGGVYLNCQGFTAP